MRIIVSDLVLFCESNGFTTILQNFQNEVKEALPGERWGQEGMQSLVLRERR
jgi:hypothetical protein